MPAGCENVGHEYYYTDPGWACIECGYEPSEEELQGWLDWEEQEEE